MAHELSFTNGVADAFFVRQTAWHNEGHLLNEAPSYEEALRLANLDYDVEVKPAYVRHESQDGGEYFTASSTGRVVIRTDNDAELGSVGTAYKALQNRDAFRSLVPLIETGVAQLETGGVLREGADAWLLVKFDIERFGPIVREVFTDEVVPFGLVANNHNGRRGVLLQLTPIRVVCANTLGASESRIGQDSKINRAIVVKHTTNVESAVVDAAENLFRGLVERYEVVARQYKLLKSTILEESEFRRYILDVIAPDPREAKSFNPEASRAELVLRRADEKRAELSRLWENGAGHTGDHSAWEGYNAVTEALDHNADLFPTRGGAWRTASLLDGQYATLKNQVLDQLVTVAASR